MARCEPPEWTEARRLPQTAPVVIVGAGPAGLATAACLKSSGIQTLLLDRAGSVGSSWRAHYERLHLHTARSHSGLPGRPMPRSWPTFPSRQQVTEYLQDYAEHFDLRPWLRTEVESLERSGDGWRVTTDRGVVLSPFVVIATGYNRVPRRPHFPGQDRFSGLVLHSSEFRSGQDFAGQRVVVVGCGNSGAEIALDLAEHGAKTSLVVRNPIHVTPREVLGNPTQVTSIRLSFLPVGLADFISMRVLRWLVGDLRPWGIHRPTEGPNAQIWKHGRVPLIDVGTIDRIKDGTIAVRPAVQSVGADTVRFVDGSEDRCDAMVLATGYDTGLADFLDGACVPLDDRGRPLTHGDQSAPGLFFVGFRNPPTGALREIGLEAKRVSSALASASALGA